MSKLEKYLRLREIRGRVIPIRNYNSMVVYRGQGGSPFSATNRRVTSLATEHLSCSQGKSQEKLCSLILSDSESNSSIIMKNHSFSILSDDRSKDSSKTMPPHSAIQNLLLQMTISSPVLNVIQ